MWGVPPKLSLGSEVMARSGRVVPRIAVRLMEQGTHKDASSAWCCPWAAWRRLRRSVCLTCEGKPPAAVERAGGGDTAPCRGSKGAGAAIRGFFKLCLREGNAKDIGQR